MIAAMYVHICKFAFCRKYFKMRNEACKDDVIILNKFEVIQLKERLQNNAHNCGVYCLKVHHLCSYTVIIIRGLWMQTCRWLNSYSELEMLVKISSDILTRKKLEYKLDSPY